MVRKASENAKAPTTPRKTDVKAPVVTPPPVKNTSGLEKFARARDAVLARKGFKTFNEFTEATRRTYNTNNLSGFDGWRTARDITLKNAHFPEGYTSLMAESKKEFARM